MLLVDASSRLSAAYSVVVLPLPVGPVTSTMPCVADQAVEPLQHAGAHAQAFELEAGFLSKGAARRARRGRSARWTRVDRPSARAARCGVLRQALGDVQVGHDLDARDAACSPFARADHVAQRAVDAVAHHRMGLEGSMWISLAPSRAAWANSALIMRMTGASSWASSRSATSRHVRSSRSRSISFSATPHRGGILGMAVGRRQQRFQRLARPAPLHVAVAADLAQRPFRRACGLTVSWAAAAHDSTWALGARPGIGQGWRSCGRPAACKALIGATPLRSVAQLAQQARVAVDTVPDPWRPGCAPHSPCRRTGLHMACRPLPRTRWAMRSASDCESTERIAAWRWTCRPRHTARRDRTLTPSGMLTRNGWAGSLVWRAAGYWRRTPPSRAAGGAWSRPGSPAACRACPTPTAPSPAPSAWACWLGSSQ